TIGANGLSLSVRVGPGPPKFATAAAVEHEDARRARQVAAAFDVDRGEQRINRNPSIPRELAQRLPELRLQRDAGRMPGDSHRALYRRRRIAGHCKNILKGEAVFKVLAAPLVIRRRTA